MKPYYEHAGITIYHGDCRELLPGVEADAVVADPPYGIAHPTNFHTRGLTRLAAAHDYPPVYGDDEPFDPSPLLRFPQAILWGANYYADKLPPSSGWLVWDKKRRGLDQADAELAWTPHVKGVRVFEHLWNGCMVASERGERYHPTQKPVALMRWCLGFTDGPLVDPYMGAGPTLVAAKQLGRRAIGIEIEERYCEIAAERLSQDILPGIYAAP